jgi:integrase/recombinase XerC
LRALRAFIVSNGGADDASKVGSAMLRRWLASRFDHDQAPTLVRKLSAIRAFYRFLMRRGIVRENPASVLRAPKIAKPLPKFLTVDEAFRVVEAPNEDAARAEPLRRRDRAMLELLYGTGIRVGELAVLKLRDVDLRYASARVIGKGNKERVVPIGRAALDALVAYLGVREVFHGKDGSRDPEAFFLGRFGTPLTARQAQNVVRRYGALGAGRGDLHPHALRHTCATHLLDAGADLRTIQELLGHASLSTTQRYTHVSIDRLMEVYDKAHPLAHQPVSSKAGDS